MRTIAYDVIGVNVFLRTLMRILRKKGVNSVRPILLPCLTIPDTLNGSQILRLKKQEHIASIL